MIWNPQSECQAIEERKLLQLARLKNLVETLYSRVPFYRRKFDAAGVRPSDLKSLADIAKFPFTVKDDLRETYPYGLLACPEPEIEEIHMSSGTTGVPVVDAYTRYDVECWEEAHGEDPERGRRDAGTTPCRTATATASSPAAWASTTAPSASAPTSFRCPRAIRRSS